MTLDPRTPVLVGAAAVQQHIDDPELAREPVALMGDALEGAADDAGDRDLLSRADWISVPRGFWSYGDPGRLLAERFGAKDARTGLAEIGVLQTSLFARAAAAIRDGGADVVLVAGGEAKHRSRCAEKAGGVASLTEQGEAVPDEVLRPAAEIVTEAEIRNGLGGAVHQYSVMENALRASDRISLDAHRREVAELCAGFSAVAAENPHAWNREAVTAETILAAGGRNRMLAFPYSALHTSQWNVDQAAGLVFCSVATARAARIPEDRWVFPRAVAESNHMTPLTKRAELHRCRAFGIAGRRALELAGAHAEGVSHLELYSCFPVAVRMQARELGIPAERVLTVTGGMTFAGGPLNNFVLQAAARMADVLRGDPGSVGLVSAVSGIVTKQGFSVWSSEPGERGYGYADVADEVAAETRTVEVLDDFEGTARVESYTVIYGPEIPMQGIVLCDVGEGRRTLATTDDLGLMRAMTEEEFCGRSVRIREERFEAA